MEYRYDIYTKANDKLNKSPLSKAELDFILKQKVIYKNIDGVNKKFNIDDLDIKKCIII